MNDIQANYAYVNVNAKLAMYAKKATVEHWSNRHQATDSRLRHQLRPTKQIWKYRSAFKYLPPQGTILEAGCGGGVWVNRLLQNKWNAVGLDYDFKTIAHSKNILPSLPFIAGDVYSLPFQDNSLSGYISFGVVEHDCEGPRKILKEAYRVLHKGGIAIVSVPYRSPLRKHTVTVSEENAISQGLEFYQYYFTYKQLKDELVESGLEPITNFQGYSVSIGLTQGFHVMKKILPYLGKFSIVLDSLPFLQIYSAHMMLLCAVKPD